MNTSFLGFFKLGVETVWGTFTTEDSDGSASDPEATPTFVSYSEDGDVIDSGNCVVHDAGPLTGSYRFSFLPTSPNYTRGKSYEVKAIYSVSGVERYPRFRFTLT